MSAHTKAVLTMSNGVVILGESVGAEGLARGELCFTTAMTGYQEAITDPSFAGQVLVFAAPHVGNVGANSEDFESAIPFLRGVVMREIPTEASNHRARLSLRDFLIAHNIVAIADIDTRALIHTLRTCSPCHCTIETFASEAPPARELRPVTQEDIVDEVRAHQVKHQCSAGGKRVVLIDYGVKLNIISMLERHGCDVILAPLDATYEEVMAHNPDGILLSNGPGDPALLYKEIKPNLDRVVRSGVPIFGICLGHQLLALSLGCNTVKMQQGHRGLNHPIKCLETDAVAMTTQNHGFVVDPASLKPEVIVTHVSLFDNSIAGIKHASLPIFSVQYHPESSPGPHDSHVLFAQFISLLDGHNQPAQHQCKT
jgi:carbamoyl-phosphate synthase small subunit